MTKMNVPSKELKKLIERIRQPSGQCQACLSDKSSDKDFIITCQICQSSIHHRHYGKEIEDFQIISFQKWRCQRCRIIIRLADKKNIEGAAKIHCMFCPSNKGILKRVYFNNQIIWLHPQCATWCFPLIYQKNAKRQSYLNQFPSKPTGKFWVSIQNQKQSACQMCKQVKGYKIKCMYYSCFKYFHATCAKKIGFIRDLQTMRFQNSQTYIPTYCEQHIQKRVEDCSIKAKKYNSVLQTQKASHFMQMMSSYAIQLKNMQQSARKYRQDEQIRLQMEYNADDDQDMIEQFSITPDNSFRSNHPDDFYDFLEGNSPDLINKRELVRKESIKKKEIQKQEEKNAIKNIFQRYEDISHQNEGDQAEVAQEPNSKQMEEEKQIDRRQNQMQDQGQQKERENIKQIQSYIEEISVPEFNFQMGSQEQLSHFSQQ